MQSNSERARALVIRAREADVHGQASKSLGLFDDAIALMDSNTDQASLADALRWKGTVHREQGETEAAFRCYRQSLAHADAAGSAGSRAHAHNCLAIIAQRRGDLRESEDHYALASTLAATAGEQRLLGMIEQNRGVMMNMTGDFAAAERRYDNSLQAFEKAGDEEAVSWVLNNAGMLHARRGHYQRAIESFERGREIAKRRKDVLVDNILTLNLAEVFAVVGKLNLADEFCKRALDEARRRGDHLTVAGALKCQARIERERGAFTDSLATLRIAIFEAEGLEDRLLQAELQREFGQTARSLGNAADARHAWLEAAQSFEGIGALHDAAEISSLLKSLPG